MSSGYIWLIVAAVALVVLAGVFSAADAALAGFSKARARELADRRRTGSLRLMLLLEDAPRYLNTVMLLRLLCEIAAIVITTQVVRDFYDGANWLELLTSIAVMLVVSFVVVGVAPRTLGRQHADRVALFTATPVTAITSILGPIPQLLILLGNAITPGKGFREGPFSTETELREMVDLAQESSLIEDSERRMVHGVFELGDTTAREVMVPRNDVVFVERHKNLKQTLSLFLRSGFSRLPVVGENLDHVVGFVYLKDVVRRDFEAPEVQFTQRAEEVMRSAHFVPDSKPVDSLLAEMQAMRQHIAVVVDEYGGTAGLITIEDVLEEIVGEITDEYDPDEENVEHLGEGRVRVPSRYPVDDLDELFDVRFADEDVDTVAGLMAKHLGRVPIPGAHVDVHGLRFEAEAVTGRRNRVGTVVISLTTPDPGPLHVDARDERRASGGRADARDERRASGGRADARDERRASGGRADARDERRASGGRADARDERRVETTSADS